MTEQETIETRVATLEEEVDRLRRRFEEQPAPNWLQRIAGSFGSEPEFDRVLELGRSIRQADRPDGGAPE